ncbi:MAG: ligase-associated DNA damage response endonuclease PdeM [Pseudomonadota bacterium]
MSDHDFRFGDAACRALAVGALWLPDHRLLVVSDLHLGKADRIARREGRLTPPYEVTETLTRLADLVALHAPAVVICLGDSFDGPDGAARLTPAARHDLAALMAGRRWIWIAGNHDPAPMGLGGEYRASVTFGDTTFRHVAETAAKDISGHYHPKAWVRGRGRPAFVVDSHRVILPAFGTYTGGLDVCDPVFDPLFGPNALVLMTGRRIIAAPRAGLLASAERRKRAPMRPAVAAPFRTGA